MKSISFKKLSLVLLCGLIILGSLLLVGCNESEQSYEEQGFVAVCEVEYQTNSDIKLLRSFYEISYTVEEISATELGQVNSVNNLSIPPYEGNKTIKCYMDSNKEIAILSGGIDSFSSQVSNGDVDFFSYGYLPPDTDNEIRYYYKRTVTNVDVNYIYVKILEENKIEIINDDNERFIVNTPFYSINYFN